MIENEGQKERTNHSLGLGIKGSDKIRRILLLKSNTRPERMTLVILKYTPSSIINQHQPLLSTHVSKSEGTGHVSTDGLDLVGFAPVDVGPAGDTGGIKNMSRIEGGDVSLEGGSVLEASGGVGVVYGLGLTELSEQAPDPAGAAVD